MNILLPVDGSEGALAAVRHVLDMVSEGLRAHVVLANVQEEASLYELVTAHDSAVIERVRAEAAADALVRAREILSAAGIDHETDVELGDPARVLPEIAERFHVDLIVLGAHGIGHPERRHGLGSVAAAVTNTATAVVAVVRAPAPVEVEEDDVRATVTGAEREEPAAEV